MQNVMELIKLFSQLLSDNQKFLPPVTPAGTTKSCDEACTPHSTAVNTLITPLSAPPALSSSKQLMRGRCYKRQKISLGEGAGW